MLVENLDPEYYHDFDSEISLKGLLGFLGLMIAILVLPVILSVILWPILWVIWNIYKRYTLSGIGVICGTK